MIDKNSPIPLYFQNKNQLFKHIEDETYKSGERLPSEWLLAQCFNVTRTTLRQAVQMLVTQGYLESRRGSGIFVSDRLHYPSDKRIEKNTFIKGLLLPDIQARRYCSSRSHSRN